MGTHTIIHTHAHVSWTWRGGLRMGHFLSTARVRGVECQRHQEATKRSSCWVHTRLAGLIPRRVLLPPLPGIIPPSSASLVRGHVSLCVSLLSRGGAGAHSKTIGSVRERGLSSHVPVRRKRLVFSPSYSLMSLIIMTPPPAPFRRGN